jgi:hypothetical protein
MKNWPTFRLMQLGFRASQRAFAKARCDVFRVGGTERVNDTETVAIELQAWFYTNGLKL